MKTLPVVLHVLPIDAARGAQRYARALVDHLDGRGARHRTLTMFESRERVLDADVKLDLPRVTAARLGFDPRVVGPLRAAVQQSDAAVVVAHGGEPLKYLALCLPFSSPMIYYKIGLVTPEARRGARRLLHSALLRRPSWVAGVSEECLEEAHRVFGVPRERLVLVPNGRSPGQFRPRDEGPPRDTPILTFVGHLSSSKRPGLFIELVRRLSERGVRVEARMVGEGPLRAELADDANRAGVTLLGRRDDVAALLRESDVFVFTSIPEGEGMPGVLIEAGLSGVPIVTTDVPGARAVVRHGETGYVVGVDAAEDLVARASTLVQDAGLRSEMGHRARAHCMKELTLERSAELWETLLARAMASQAGAEHDS